ncbi:MAG TPA: hypothetical protein VFF73_34580 [Planctomycetota bacterium]|nr:hypothetical protein [Planctomycetota bacterium]
MPRVTLPLNAPLTSRLCVMCGDEGEPKLATFHRIPPAAWILVIFLGLPGLVWILLTSRSRTLQLPFTEECFRRWKFGRNLGALSFFMALCAPGGGMLAAEQTGDPSWTLKGIGTAIVLLGFPAFLRYSKAWGGPSCVAIRDQETVIWIPSDEAAHALSGTTPPA